MEKQAALQRTTLNSILNAAKEEFLEKGFLSASLRNIVKTAGVTTGAFYGYFQNKEDLFDALVKETADSIMSGFMNAQNSFTILSPEQQLESVGEFSGEYMEWLTEYVYERFEYVKLLICRAEGTKYENFVHNMCEIEVDATHRFISVMKSMGHPVKEIDMRLEHILVSGMFSAFFEMVVHDMPKAQAVRFVKELKTFYTAGWLKIMGL